MISFLFSNFAESTLASPMSSSVNELNVLADDADKFPVPVGDEVFALVLDDGMQPPEIVHATTNHLDGTIDVLRGREGTVGTGWLTGTAVRNSFTAQAFEPSTKFIVPTGAVMMLTVDEVPDGWLPCDGRTISRVTYVDLFIHLGVTFGPGDGTTTFEIPDFRGYFPRFWDEGAGIDSGRTLGSIQAEALKEHSHELLVGDSTTPDVDLILVESATAGTNGATEVTGDGETRPVNVSLQPCIKY